MFKLKDETVFSSSIHFFLWNRNSCANMNFLNDDLFSVCEGCYNLSIQCRP